MKRKVFSLLAAVVMFATIGGATDRASAAIRLTISDGINPDQVFFSPINAAAFSGTFGDFDFFLQSAGTDNPGSATGAFLAQSVILDDNSGATGGIIPTITFTADVVTAFGSSTPLSFSFPSGSPLLVMSDFGASETNSNGFLQADAILNGTTVLSSTQPLTPTSEGNASVSVNVPPGGFTLSNVLVLSGVPQGIRALVIDQTITVTGPPANIPEVPEPISLAVWGVGAVGLAFAARRRRLAGKASA
ncbi:MAG: hypothetical protein WD872_21855 [Pirellulaceae bacterium]